MTSSTTTLPQRRGAEHRWLIAFAVVLAALMQVIDSSIVNVALPEMMGNLGASLDEIAWVPTGYILASVIIIPLTGFLGLQLGRKNYFVGSIITFTASSFMCGASSTLGALIFWRIVQGIGGGALMTVSQAILLESFSVEEAGTAMALFGLSIMVGPTIGPTLGGWLTDNYGWPWIFYINIPLGILSAWMVWTYVHDSEHSRKPPAIDYIGIALLVVSVGALQYVLEHGEREDWFDSKLILSLSIVGVTGGILLLWRELTTDHPAIDFRIMRHRQMWVGTLLGVVMGIGLFAMIFALPVFMQGVLHLTAEQTGIVLLPGAIATAVSMGITGRLTNRVDPRIFISTGTLLFAYSAWQLSLITGEAGTSDFFWPLVFRGLGLGMMFVPLTVITLAELSTEELPQGTGLYNFFRQLGGSFGIAAISTLVIRYTAQTRSTLVEHIGKWDPATLARLDALTHGMMASGSDPFTAKQQAHSILDHEVMGQASVIAYSKIYLISAMIILSLIPLLLLIRNTKRAGGSPVMME